MDWHKLKIAYLHGRPGPHHMSKALAQAISAEFHFIDEFARWHDLPLPAWKRYRLANETLYFLYANYYHPITKRGYIYALSHYNALITSWENAAELSSGRSGL
jgi:hypothetical protein